MLEKFRKDNGKDEVNDADEVVEIIDDARAEDMGSLEEEAGPAGRAFIAAVDKAVDLQSGAIRAYVHWLRRQEPEQSPAEIQHTMDKHFKNAVSATGAGVGAAAAVPGVGLITGAAAVAGESVVFLDLAAFYTLASMYLRDVDIDDKVRRRAGVLTVLMGAQGVAIVDTLLGADRAQPRDLASKNVLTRFAGPGLAEANGILSRVAMKSFTKRFRRAWIGKMLPLGLGAIAGTAANRKLADHLMDNIAVALGTPPANFLSPLPEKPEKEEAGLSANPKNLLRWVLQLFGDDDKIADAREAEAPQEITK